MYFARKFNLLMREATFLNQNEKKWRKVESMLSKSSKLSSEETAHLFTELTDDLSYAQTHYPESVVTNYLNSLTSGIYQKLATNRKTKLSRFVQFWRTEVPTSMSYHLNSLLVVFLFFAFTVGIGALSTHFDEAYPRVVLGDGYVDQTLENIEQDDPMAIYKSEESLSMFFRITINNLKVSAKFFAGGIVFGMGTLYFLFTNGIMLGTFQYFFVTKSLFISSFLSIWIHGTLEILSLIVAGTAGLILGRSVLFPGSFSRIQSLTVQGKNALKIYVGTVPLIIVAGFLESYVTRLTELHWTLKFSIILISFLFMVYYFVVLPLQIRRNRSSL